MGFFIGEYFFLISLHFDAPAVKRGFYYLEAVSVEGSIRYI